MGSGGPGFGKWVPCRRAGLVPGTVRGCDEGRGELVRTGQEDRQGARNVLFMLLQLSRLCGEWGTD